MNSLLKVSGLIDAINERVGSVIKWCILAAVVISTVNAIIRKVFNNSSNAWLEAQWYLFAAVFMLGAAYTFLRNEHIRIDIVTSNFSKRTRDWIDVIGHVLFLLPFCWIMIWHGIPFFLRSYSIGEASMNAGGLVQWPAKVLIPAGFILLFAQGISELIKRIAIIRGLIEDTSTALGGHAAAEAEAERLLQQAAELNLADRK
ncbi:MAG: TRAP transporter small permease subunit [Proteobacteria bacterium]|nr:TRAP transporter small permease subunit [Pseudomonadota bacterium]